jgi:hypothetical protein
VTSTATVESPVVEARLPRARAALRVAVGRGNAGGSLAVTLLAEGQTAPEGTREALLVALDPDTDFSLL